MLLWRFGPTNTIIYRLVGGFNPSEKYKSQLGWFFPIYAKIKDMFQTTNQPIIDNNWPMMARNGDRVGTPRINYFMPFPVSGLLLGMTTPIGS